MADILFWISIFSGGLLIVMLVLSLIGGLDFDFEIGGGDTEVDGGSGGIGFLKAFLTFLSVSSWVYRVMLIANKPSAASLLVGILCGIVASLILIKLLALLLKQQQFNTWEISDTLYKKGKVYLKIPSGKGQGIVQIEINGTVQDLKASTTDEKDIATGSEVYVIDTKEKSIVVSTIPNNNSITE